MAQFLRIQTDAAHVSPVGNVHQSVRPKNLRHPKLVVEEDQQQVHQGEDGEEGGQQPGEAFEEAARLGLLLEHPNGGEEELVPLLHPVTWDMEG